MSHSDASSARSASAHGAVGRLRQQDQDVDVGMREQLAAAVAADRDQRGARSACRHSRQTSRDDLVRRGARGRAAGAAGPASRRIRCAAPSRRCVQLRRASCATRGRGDAMAAGSVGDRAAASIGTRVRRACSSRRSGCGRRRGARPIASGPRSRPAVTSTVCSHCADSEWSSVTIVQPSARQRMPAPAGVDHRLDREDHARLQLEARARRGRSAAPAAPRGTAGRCRGRRTRARPRSRGSRRASGSSRRCRRDARPG